MKYKKTKEGKEFEGAIAVIKARIEKQLKLNGKLKKGQAFDVDVSRRGAIGANVWEEDNLLYICFFHPNGKFKH